MTRSEIVRFTCDTRGCDQKLEVDRSDLVPTVGRVVTENQFLADADWGRVSNGSVHSILCGAHMADFRKFFPEPERAAE